MFVAVITSVARLSPLVVRASRRAASAYAYIINTCAVDAAAGYCHAAMPPRCRRHIAAAATLRHMPAYACCCHYIYRCHYHDMSALIRYCYWRASFAMLDMMIRCFFAMAMLLAARVCCAAVLRLATLYASFDIFCC